jgi:glycosyltransferase involved in cell wall biosynthesis
LKGAIGSLFDIITARAADKIICPSPDLKNLVDSYCFLDGTKTHVVPNGIDLESYSNVKCENAGACLEELGLENKDYALYIGRLSVLKGAQYAIEAFKKITDQCPNLKLAIVGKGDFEHSLRSLAGKNRNIIFTGHVNSLVVRKTLYENSLFVIVPSLYEVFPMVVLEAMACGKPVIASKVGGIPMLVRHGKTGFLTKPATPEEIARFLNILCEDRKLGENMGALGRRIIEEEFTVDRMVDRTLRVYESLLLSN